MRMTADAFDQLCQLARLRPASTATTSARLVLVDGQAAADVARQLGVHAGTVANAVSHARAAARLAAGVASGVTDTAATAARRGRPPGPAKPRPPQGPETAGMAPPPSR